MVCQYGYHVKRFRKNNLIVANGISVTSLEIIRRSTICYTYNVNVYHCHSVRTHAIQSNELAILIQQWPKLLSEGTRKLMAFVIIYALPIWVSCKAILKKIN